MGGLHFGLGDLEGLLVSLLRVVEDGVSGVADGDLGQVAVVVALHLQVEDFRFGVAGLGDQILVEKRLERGKTKDIIIK